MKRFITVLSVLILACTFAACGRRVDPPVTTPSATWPSTDVTMPTVNPSMPTMETNIPDPSVDPYATTESAGATTENRNRTQK